MEKIALHTFHYLNTPARISTVKIFGRYETMVMFDDGDEIEVYYSDTLEEARKTHNKVMHAWNDKLYEGSTAKLLGAPNVGQFMKPIITC